MGTASTWIYSVAGLLLIGFVLRDVFQVVFHPAGRGTVSSWIPHAVWIGARRVGRPAALRLAAPTGLLATIALWGTLLGLGWALVYLPHLSEAFLLDPELEPERNDGFVTALYLSFVTLATLGYGDIAPTAGWLRIMAPAEAALGFALLTASVSWVIALHPAVARKRAFVHRTALLSFSDPQGLARERPDVLAARLAELTVEVVSQRQSLFQYPISYYFHDEAPQRSFSTAVLEMRELADRLRGPGQSSVALRAAAQELWQAINDYAETLHSVIPGFEDGRPERVLAAARAAHPPSS